MIESGGGTIEAYHLHLLNEKAIVGTKASTGRGSVPEDLPLNLEQAEIEITRRALARADGNISKAAQLLGINRTKVYRILSQSDSVSG